ncbi:MAG: hypothetical protein WB771_08855 [Solirubrobacterales bacterium]
MRTGYRLALGVVSITVAAAVVLTVIEAVGANRDARAYGEVPVPGRESVNLPAGEVIIFYGERLGRNGDARLRVPPNLGLRVRTTNGQSLLGSTPYAFSQFDDGDYVRRSVAKLKVPEAGNYEAVTPTTPPGAVDPVISFGRNGTKDFGYVLFVLAGGFLLAAILGIGTMLVARTERA